VREYQAYPDADDSPGRARGANVVTVVIVALVALVLAAIVVVVSRRLAKHR
jgi:hypothetical protein